MRLDKSLKYKERLFNEWMQHGKIVIAVDFDDTVSPWKLNSVEDIEKSGIFELLRNAKYTGAYLVAFTACKEDRFDEIRGFFRSKGLELDSINQNPIELPYGNHSKIYANIFLDDRAGLNEAMEILNDAMYMYRGVLQTRSLTENSPE